MVCYINLTVIKSELFLQTRGALLPVLNKQGRIVQLPWGRRENQHGHLPLGGWARLESIKTGQWDYYFPKPVKLPLLKFMENDYKGKNNWFDLVAGQYLQGLVATENDEQRVYVVTVTASRLDMAVYDHWPRVIWS